MRANRCLTAALMLSGCATPASPSLPLFGAYFPSWLLCLVAGIVGAIIIRLAFIRLGIDSALPVPLLAYLGIAVLIGCVVALTVYGR